MTNTYNFNDYNYNNLEDETYFSTIQGGEQEVVAEESYVEPMKEAVVGTPEVNTKKGEMVMNDEQLNQLLGGIDKMPTLTIPFDEPEEDKAVFRPMVTESLYKAKGFVKGAKLEGSFYDSVSALMNKIAESHVTKPINELENGLFNEAVRLIEWGKEKGVVFNLPEFKVARERIKARDGVFNENCPVEALIKYRQDIQVASEALNDFRNGLFARFEHNGGQVLLDKGKVSTDWLLRKVGADKEVVDQAAKLEAYKDAVTSRYAAITEKFGQGATFAPAVLVGELYVANIKEQTANREKARKDLIVNMVNKYIDKYGFEPNEEMSNVIREAAAEKVKEYSDSGFSSIQSLFPLGFVQFLQWIEAGEVKTVKRKQEYVNVFLASDKLITEEEKTQWLSRVGDPILFANGVVDERYHVSTEDLVQIDKPYVSPKHKDIKHLDEAAQEELMSNKFKRGAKLWVGGHQAGILMHVKVYRSGVSLFLKNFKTL